MIALRRTLERGARHRLLGPVLGLLLALLLAFALTHGGHDQMHAQGSALVVCIAFLMVAIVTIVRPQPLPAPRAWRRPARGPPARTAPCSQAAGFAVAPRSIPLRL